MDKINAVLWIGDRLASNRYSIHELRCGAGDDLASVGPAPRIGPVRDHALESTKLVSALAILTYFRGLFHTSEEAWPYRHWPTGLIHAREPGVQAGALAEARHAFAIAAAWNCTICVLLRDYLHYDREELPDAMALLMMIHLCAIAGATCSARRCHSMTAKAPAPPDSLQETPLLIERLKFLMTLLLLVFLVQMLNVMTENALLAYGIYPRDITKLPHILTAPFIHASWEHFFQNIASLAIFTGMCLLLRNRRFFISASAFIVVLSGLMVWLFGRDGLHVGASAWIFGLWSLCILLAFFDRSFVNFIVAIVTVVLFGGMVSGLIPFESRISFEGHVFGAFSGICAAYFLSRHGKAPALQ